jgi:hypothetical protein
VLLACAVAAAHLHNAPPPVLHFALIGAVCRSAAHGLHHRHPHLAALVIGGRQTALELHGHVATRLWRELEELVAPYLSIGSLGGDGNAVTAPVARASLKRQEEGRGPKQAVRALDKFVAAR